MLVQNITVNILITEKINLFIKLYEILELIYFILLNIPDTVDVIQILSFGNE